MLLLRISNRATLLRGLLSQPKPYFPSSDHHQRRHRSSHSRRGQLIEVDLQSVSSSDGEMEIVGVKKLEETIHRIAVLKSTPDWLPFLPGSSFWVPPRSHSRSPSDIAQMLVKMANADRHALSDDEALSLTTFQGWPSSSFFQDSAVRHSSNADVEVTKEVNEDVELILVELEAKVEVETEAEANDVAVDETQVPSNSGKTPQSGNEEG